MRALLCVLARALGGLESAFLDVPLDHFDSGSSATFPLRYLVDATHHRPGARPTIVVYTGNEGPITAFANSTGVVPLLAERLGAFQVFIEERYYGASVPQEPLKYLSSAQVLADFVLVLSTLGGRFFDTQPAIVAVGGSYGGMLTAWLQRQHPDLVTAAWASSAPLLGFAEELAKANRTGGYYRAVERNYLPPHTADAACAPRLRRALEEVWGPEQRPEPALLQSFRVCPEAPGRADLRASLVGFLQRQLGDIAQLDYPYAVEFLGRKLPAQPARALCSSLAASGAAPLEALRGALALPDGCLDLEAFEAYTPGLMPGPWTYQRCTEFEMAFSVPEDARALLPCSVFPHNCWDEAARARFAAFCAARFNGSRPEPRGAAFWSSRWDKVLSPRLLLTNGELDPWSYGGVPAGVWIPDAAHHLDLRAPDAADPPAVRDARSQAIAQLVEWVDEHFRSSVLV